MRARCTATRQDGQPCTAYANRTGWCRHHETPEQRNRVYPVVACPDCGHKRQLSWHAVKKHGWNVTSLRCDPCRHALLVAVNDTRRHRDDGFELTPAETERPHQWARRVWMECGRVDRMAIREAEPTFDLWLSRRKQERRAA